MSQHPISPELAARATAAAAVLADFNRELHTAPLSNPPGREWMLKLARALESVLSEIGDADLSGRAQPGGGWLSGPMLPPSSR